MKIDDIMQNNRQFDSAATNRDNMSFVVFFRRGSQWGEMDQKKWPTKKLHRDHGIIVLGP